MAEYHNPQQQEPGAQKNLILVFILTFVIIVIAQQFFFKKPAQPPAGQSPQQQQEQTPSPAANTSPTPATTQPAAPKSATAVPAKQASNESDVVVENDFYRITFTNRGAQVKSWILKKYNDSQGKPLELVHRQAAEKYGYPLSFFAWDQGLRDKLNSALYVTDASAKLTAPATLTYEYSDGDLVVRKTFKFENDYTVSVQTSVARNGQYVTALPAWPAGFGDMTTAATYGSQQIAYNNGSKIERIKSTKVSGGAVYNGTLEWGGVLDQYFAAIFLPNQVQQGTLVELHYPIEIPKDPAKPDPNNVYKLSVLGAAVGNLSGPTNERIFVGPKALDVLERVHPAGADTDLRGVVDFGMFSFIAHPLFLWLHWTYDHWVSNWGWSILILTVIINAALLPLRVMSMRSALKMQKVAPQIQSINEKYKKYSLKDPRRAEAQKEISALYKEHNVNPAGGCLPMLVQMPFLFAFWAMLSASIELRGAHWLWLNDLSQPDHYYIIPIVIILSTMFMQKMTPQAGMNPEQARMMNLMMPLMLGFMSWSVASGLGVYWLTGTIVGIIQQWAMNRTSLGQEIRALQEKRARKQEAKKGK